MKKLILTSVLVCFFVIGYSQSDTLYTKKQQKIPCKIIEINEFEIKYKMAGSTDGPVYVVNKTTVSKYTLANGYTERLLPDELSLENEHADILKNRSAIKLHPFSIVNGQISMAYEKVIRVGMNLDIEVGYSNSSFTDQNIYGRAIGAFNTGAYIKPGVKFFLGQDYSVRGLKYAHPLKGRYIKLDLALSYLNFQGLTSYIQTGGPWPTPYNTQSINTNMNAFAYGGFVNYGRQFILGNILTFEYYVGVGFTGQGKSYSNPEYQKALSQYGRIYDYSNNVSNYHGFLRTEAAGLSVTGGFRIGYILPEKKAKKTTRVD